MNITKEQSIEIDKLLDKCRCPKFKTILEYDEEYKVVYIEGFVQADVLKEIIQKGYEMYHTSDNKICIFMRQQDETKNT